MTYYPKSQIKTDLYTNGEGYILSTTGEQYTGYFYETSNGNKYTGKHPNNPPNILLTNADPTFDDETATPTQIIFLIDDNYNYTINDRNIPLFNTPLPTTQDNQNGQFYRYFCKKTNELRYLETDKDTYQKLNAKDSKIAWDLYNPIKILWTLKGNKELVYSSNKGTVLSIEQNLKWYGFSQYFKDNFTKYYLES